MVQTVWSQGKVAKEPIKGGFKDLLGIGGSPSLDFLNTISARGTQTEFDRLANYSDLVNWVKATDIVSEKELHEIKRVAKEAPEMGQTCFNKAIKLREVLYDTFVNVIRDETTPENLTKLSELIFPLIAASTLRIEVSNKFRLEHKPSLNVLNKPIWLVAWDTFRLTTGTELSRLKQCESCSCSWVFLDNSKNGRRRWCSMQECGNAIKAREYRARRRNSDHQ